MNARIKKVLEGIAPVSFQHYAGSEKTYITFFTVSQSPETYADDEPYDEGVYVQVDVWSDKDCSNIVKQVRRAMKEAGFMFRNGADLYEEQTKAYHKALDFYFSEV